MNFKPSYTFCFIFIIVFGLQILVLHLQGSLGPRFFYRNYYKNVRNAEYEYLVEMTKSINSHSDVENVCAICLNDLHEEEENPTAESRLIIEGLDLKKHRIIKTNCKHKFHKSCFIEWMRRKKDCPVCR
mmetsp:Transcript_19834/g.16987  ORF Transcript_19834/g.16987 Transcript_19834/m.16987 type:complete len:129 (-) Transcript_19834:164-550(-)